MVAFDTHKGMGGPWNMVRGNIESLGAGRCGVIMDQLYLEKKKKKNWEFPAWGKKRKSSAIGHGLWASPPHTFLHHLPTFSRPTATAIITHGSPRRK